MPRLRVAYDSNIYRGIGKKFSEIMTLERARGIRPAALYPVVEELTAHLVSPDDPDFGSAGMALERLGKHCATFDGQEYHVEFVADAGQQIEHRLLGTVHEASIASEFGGIVGAITEAKSPDDLKDYTGVFRSIQDRVSDSRSVFAGGVSALADASRKRIDAAIADKGLVLSSGQRRAVTEQIFRSDDTVREAARFVVRQVAEAAQMPEAGSPAEAEAIGIVSNEYEMPLRLFNELVLAAVLSGQPLTGDSSLAYDFRVAFATGKGAMLNGIPVWLITSDAAILDAAERASVRRKVLSQEEYFAVLERPSDEIEELVRLSMA